jgi:hypothetical protein
VCILRAEAEGEQLVITVTTNHDLDRRMYSARPASARRTAEVEEAVAFAAEFLRTFAAAEGGAPGATHE